MSRRNRIISLLLALGLAGLAAAAGAEVMTLGVYFRGETENAGGESRLIPLSGSFRVLQGGMEKGIVRAGETTVTVDGTDPVTLVVMPETVEAGWDLTETRTTVAMADGGNVTVPILVGRLTENTVARAPETEAPAENTETAEAGEAAESAPGNSAESPEDGEKAAAAVPRGPVSTPELGMSPVSTATTKSRRRGGWSAPRRPGC